MKGTGSINKKLIGYGIVEEIWNVSGTKILRFQQEIWHEGLKEHKVITAPEKAILINKIRVQTEKWDEKWNTIQERKRIDDVKKPALKKR